MKALGYSLVEMVVVIGIISILLAIGTLRFNEYMRRYRVEAQARQIYSELQQARVNAVYQRRATRVKLYPGHFEVYSSTRDDADGVAPVSIHYLQHSVVCTGSGDDGKGYPVDFDVNGLAIESRSICQDKSFGLNVLDSVKVSKTRVRLGRKEKGDDCDPDNISIP